MTYYTSALLGCMFKHYNPHKYHGLWEEGQGTGGTALAVEAMESSLEEATLKQLHSVRHLY